QEQVLAADHLAPHLAGLVAGEEQDLLRFLGVLLEHALPARPSRSVRDFQRGTCVVPAWTLYRLPAGSVKEPCSILRTRLHLEATLAPFVPNRLLLQGPAGR